MDQPKEHPSPPWLIAAVDQVVARMAHQLGVPVDSTDTPLAQYGLIMVPLKEPHEGATAKDFERWERTCDNCGKVCIDEPFWSGAYQRPAWGALLLIGYGACKDCIQGKPPTD